MQNSDLYNKNKSENLYTLGEVLKILRLEAQLSQAALAKKLNTITQHVQKWEYGYIKPRPENLKKIIDVCADPADSSLFSQLIRMYYI